MHQNHQVKCQNCGKPEGEHNAVTKACPIGPKTRAGVIHYDPKLTFKPMGVFVDLIQSVKCQCQDLNDPQVQIHGCVCGLQERILRAYSRGEQLRPMTDAERVWCIEEAIDSSEGSRNESELLTISDQNLAKEVLASWKEYAQSQGLL